MQTPLLFTPQTAQKNLTEVANKNESNVNKMTADSGKTPFQMALDQRVRTKQSNAQQNQAPATPIQNKKVQTAPVTEKKVVAEQQVVQSGLADGHIDKQSANDLPVEQEALLNLSESKIDVVVPKLDLLAPNLPAETKSKIEALPEDDANNVIALMAPIPLELTNKSVAETAKESTLPLLATSEKLASNKKPQDLQLDENAVLDENAELVDNTKPTQNAKFAPVLEGTLALGKNSNLVGNAAIGQQAKLGPVLEGTLAASKPGLVGKDSTDIHAQVDQVLDHSRWLSGVAGKTVSEDVSASKMMLNLAKDGIAKDMMVTPGIQPQVAQVQSQLAAQQVAQPLGSANIINAYPGKSGWDQAISQKVMWMVGASEQSASLTLNPPDLGPLKVVIHVHNNQADTTFISDNDEVRRALESGLSHLRDKMNETSVQLGQTNISSSNQSQQNFQQAAQNRVLAQTQTKTNDSLPVENVVHSRTITRSSNGLVDTFA